MPIFGWMAVMSLWCSACRVVEGGSIPSDIPNPSLFRTAQAARALASRAQYEFNQAVANYIVMSGVVSDELTAREVATCSQCGPYQVNLHDQRILPEDKTGETFQVGSPGVQTYGMLHLARGYAINTIRALQKYDSAAPPALIAELWAIQGYTMLYLADAYCSGIPLSEIEFEGDFHYAPPSTTLEVYARAIEAFDSVLAVLPPNTEGGFANLARIGKARAFLASGRSDLAATTVANVGLSYEFQIQISGNQFLWSSITVADREGINGFPFVSVVDTRTTTFVSTWADGVRLPEKYRAIETGRAPLTIASGIEAYLIRAEAALDRGDPEQWIGLLNEARASKQMGLLTDPVDSADRFRMQSDERAAWLFLTGHRQGDLRRRVRNREIPQDEVYPTGPWFGSFVSYGANTNVPIPWTENANPLYRGCLDRNA